MLVLKLFLILVFIWSCLDVYFLIKEYEEGGGA